MHYNFPSHIVHREAQKLKVLGIQAFLYFERTLQSSTSTLFSPTRDFYILRRKDELFNFLDKHYYDILFSDKAKNESVRILKVDKSAKVKYWLSDPKNFANLNNKEIVLELSGVDFENDESLLRFNSGIPLYNIIKDIAEEEDGKNCFGIEFKPIQYSQEALNNEDCCLLCMNFSQPLIACSICHETFHPYCTQLSQDPVSLQFACLSCRPCLDCADSQKGTKIGCSSCSSVFHLTCAFKNIQTKQDFRMANWKCSQCFKFFLS